MEIGMSIVQKLLEANRIKLAKRLKDLAEELTEKQDAIQLLIGEVNSIKKIDDECIVELQKLCAHTHVIKEIISHSEGGYLDKGYTVYAVKCKDCNFELDRKTKIGTYA